MRRRDLMCLAVPLAAGFARPARAWREEPASAAVALAWADRCGLPAAPTADALTLCPYCGCPVQGAPDHGERAARR